jgi:hypothetical protein
MHAHLRPAGDQMFDMRAWRGLAVVGAKRHAAVRCGGTRTADGAGMENITPAKRALAVLDTPAPAEPIPALRITKKVRAAIELMVSGDCKQIKDAAAKVGLARESLSRALSKPHVAEHLRMKVLRSLAMAAARAGAVKINLLDSDNAIGKIALINDRLVHPRGQSRFSGSDRDRLTVDRIPERSAFSR